MRTETDAFRQSDDDAFYCCAEIEDGNVLIASSDAWDVIYTSLTKQQAAEFARQLLEICGETTMNFNTYIKSPKQLHNTCITNDCPIKRDVYLALCDRFGISKSPLIHSRYLEVTIFPARSPSFAAYGVSCKDLLSPESKELYLADLVDLHDSYVMTSDFEVARKFGEMVGDDVSAGKLFKFNVVTCDEPNMIGFYQVTESNIAGIVQNKTELTPDLINAMYAEMVKLKSLNDDYATERKPVSLTDFLKRTKPMNSGEKLTQATKMKAEYVRVEDSIFDLAALFDAGMLYTSESGEQQIKTESELVSALFADSVYKRIEKPVDWRKEVESYLESACQNETDEFDEFDGMIVSSTDWMCSYNPTDDEFLEMCRVALRATGELPDTTK